MTSLSRTLMRFALVGGAVACTHGSANDHPRPDANVITRAEMERSEYTSLYEVVQALRGRWLRSRGPSTILGRQTEVQVMLDDVVMIAFVDPVTAAQRWGGKYAQGTIVVTTHAEAAPDTEPRPR